MLLYIKFEKAQKASQQKLLSDENFENFPPYHTPKVLETKMWFRPDQFSKT